MRRPKRREVQIPLDPNEVCFFLGAGYRIAANEGRIIVAANADVAEHFFPELVADTGELWVPTRLSAKGCKDLLAAMDDPKPNEVEIVFALDAEHQDERLTMTLSQFELLMTTNSLR